MPLDGRLQSQYGTVTLLVTGGSLGALRINRATIDAVERWRNRDDLAVRHSVGTRDWDVIHADEVDPGVLQYLPVVYDDDLPRTLAAADIAVGRAGASTCFEFAAAGLPAILVPSPYVTANHQTGNARHLTEAGAAVMIPDAELDGARLAVEVDTLLADPARLDAMAAAMHAFSRPRAADDIAALVEAHARD